MIASGNQAVARAADYLEFLAGEEGLGAVALYLEDDGGPRLCDGLAACAEAGVPVVVLKVGHSPAGARAAAAHSARARRRPARVPQPGRGGGRGLGATTSTSCSSWPRRSPCPPRPPAGRGARGLAIMTCSGGDSAQGADEA